MSDTLKLTQLDNLLNLGTVLVAADGRAISGLPAGLRTATHLHLRIGWDLTPPITLVLGSMGFSATLLFEGTEYRVAVPWRCVFLLIGEGEPRMQVAFPDDVPKAEAIDAPPQKRGALFSVD